MGLEGDVTPEADRTEPHGAEAGRRAYTQPKIGQKPPPLFTLRQGTSWHFPLASLKQTEDPFL